MKYSLTVMNMCVDTPCVSLKSRTVSRSFGCILYSSPLNNPLCLSTDNMVDQTKVEASEAKANELEKKVKNILIHKAHIAMSTFSLVIGGVWKLYEFEN